MTAFTNAPVVKFQHPLPVGSTSGDPSHSARSYAGHTEGSCAGVCFFRHPLATPFQSMPRPAGVRLASDLAASIRAGSLRHARQLTSPHNFCRARVAGSVRPQPRKAGGGAVCIGEYFAFCPSVVLRVTPSVLLRLETAAYGVANEVSALDRFVAERLERASGQRGDLFVWGHLIVAGWSRLGSGAGAWKPGEARKSSMFKGEL